MKALKPQYCEWHKPHGLGYLAFFRWADEQTSKGYEQRQCEDCRHWFFPNQFGTKPKNPPRSEPEKKE